MKAGWAISFLSIRPQGFCATCADPADNAGPGVGGDKSLGEVLGAQMKSVARDVTVIVLRNTGHWILEENTRETTAALTKFL